MNTSPDTLSQTLRAWRVRPPPDPDFRHKVWQRIGGAGPATWPAYLRAHLTAWSVAAVLAVGVAGFAGRAMAQARVRADREAIVVTYLVELDPRVQALLKP